MREGSRVTLFTAFLFYAVNLRIEFYVIGQDVSSYTHTNTPTSINFNLLKIRIMRNAEKYVKIPKTESRV